MQKLYCYVDETGQDISSSIFIVVAIVSEQDQDAIRSQIAQMEQKTKTGHRKWHKSKSERRMSYLKSVLKKDICRGDVFVGRYKKPLPYFLPILEILEKAIRRKVQGDYQAIILIDGIDRKKAAELTNALRVRGISLKFVRSARDESEPLIRLADMWAGCSRRAFLNKDEEKQLYEKAKGSGYLMEL